jgi:hopene-associated glycosyltransferase HpnB
LSLVAVLLAAAVWLYLLAGRGQFWMSELADRTSLPDPAVWPRVIAIIPARNEAATIQETVRSLAAQDYPGPLSLILVDDESSDGTAERALEAAQQAQGKQLTVVCGGAVEPGWTGKLFALQQGIAAAESRGDNSSYWWFTDADIRYQPDSLRYLVRRAEQGGFVLTSLMAKLRCQSLAERALIPAFIFFFQMLYPFAWVRRTDRRVAAAAGGCMLIDRAALQAAGGLRPISDALIDDCALAARLKRVGPVWLGLTNRAESLRAYAGFNEIGRMVARSAYAQLNYSPFNLAMTTFGLFFVFDLGPVVAVTGDGLAAGIGLAIWAAMALLFIPTLRFFQLSRLWGLALPLIAVSYLLFTVHSAYQFNRGYGGRWKGRIQAVRPR